MCEVDILDIYFIKKQWWNLKSYNKFDCEHHLFYDLCFHDELFIKTDPRNSATTTLAAVAVVVVVVIIATNGQSHGNKILILNSDMHCRQWTLLTCFFTKLSTYQNNTLNRQWKSKVFSSKGCMKGSKKFSRILLPATLMKLVSLCKV